MIREYLGTPEDVIECPTESQRILFGPTRRRVPKMIDLTNPVLLGPVQNQEHYMQGVVARRNHFTEPILQFFEEAYKVFGEMTGRYYGLVSEYKTEDADTVFVSLGSAAENIEAAVDYLREKRGARVGSIHPNVFRPFPEAAIVKALAGKKNVIILERTDEPMAGDNPMGRDIRTALNKALQGESGLPTITAAQMPRLFGGVYGLGSRDFRPEHVIGAYEFATGTRARKDGKKASDSVSFMVLGVDHEYEVKSDDTPSLLPGGRDCRALPLGRRLGRHHDGQEPRRHHRRPERSALRPRQSRRRVREPEGNHPRQREPQVRIREEGRADVVLHDCGAGTDSRQLRPAARQRRALLRPEGVHAHQSARRHVRGRQPCVGIGGRGRAGVGAAAAMGAQADPR